VIAAMTPSAGNLVTLPDPASVARTAAERLAATLRDRLGRAGSATIALSGGNTPRDAYTALAQAPDINWSRVEIFWVDERAVGPTDDRSNYRWAKATLVDGAHIASTSVHRMPADEGDLQAAARAYEATIRSRVAKGPDGVPSFDAVVLGIGDDGHTASLFPGESTVDIEDRWVVAVAASGPREARLTITRPVIQRAAHVFVLVVGKAKRPALDRAWAADGDLHATPSRLIGQCRGVVTWIVDEAAIR
jgi:6-phosphogluconolactonase